MAIYESTLICQSETGRAVERRRHLLGGGDLPDSHIDAYWVSVPFQVQTPHGPLQLAAEIEITGVMSVHDVFDRAAIQVPQKFEAAKTDAIKKFEAQQRMMALRQVPQLPPGFFRG